MGLFPTGVHTKNAGEKYPSAIEFSYEISRY